jgi:membrane protease YdiL (CAAX protease family)
LFGGKVSEVLALQAPAGGLRMYAVGAATTVALLAALTLINALLVPEISQNQPSTALFGELWVLALLVVGVGGPISEELLFRGYALPVVLLFERARAAKSASPFGDAFDRGRLGDVAPGAWSALAVGTSSALFAAGHHPGEWLAAFAYGALMSALWIARGDLVSCISAHATTNAALALWVRASGEWMYW